MRSPIKSDVGPFAIVPDWLIQAGVSDGGLRLFVALAMRADRESGECWPSRKTLAAEMAVTDRTIDARTDELEALGAVSKRPRWTEDGDRSSNAYTVNYAKPVSPPPVTGVATGGEVGFAVTRTSVEPERSSTRANAPDGLFDIFWSRYPRKVAKASARKAWDQAIKRGLEPDIITGAEAYARECSTAESARFIAHPATWLNGDRWLDEPDQDPNLGMLARIVAEERSKPPELNP